MPIMPDIPKAEIAIVEQSNAFRAGSKLKAVAVQPQLTKAARDFARFLSASTLFTHEADGRRPVDRIKAAGYAPCSAAENLAWHSDTRGFETMQLATMMVEGWKKSPGHRKNLLTEHATETGVAIVKARREEKYFAVQLFARPDTFKYSFSIENHAAGEVAYQLGGETTRIAPRTVMHHTACLPAEIAFEVRAAVSRFEAKDGQVYRLKASPRGEVEIEVVAK